MRLFAALELPGEARAGITQAFAGPRALAPKVKWVSPEAMHLTLHFFGEIPDSEIEGFAPVFEDPSLRRSPLRFRLGQVGFFPGGGPPRVLWAGIAEGLEEMKAFWVRFTQRIEGLRAAGGPLRQWSPDTRGFSPHITVARAGAVPLSREWAAGVKLPGSEYQVERCALFQSVLGAGGPRYVPLKTIPFTGEAA